MYTHVQRPGCKKENTATYVHMGGVSNAYSRICTARARVHGWVGTEKQGRRRVRGEPTGWVGMECVFVFIGRAWTEQAMETRPGVPQNGGNGLVFDRPRSKRDPVNREGCGVAQNGRNGLVLERYIETGVLFIGRGVAYHKTGLHGLLFISTVDLLQPPRATVHPLSTSSSPPRGHIHPPARSIGVLFIQQRRPLLPWGPIHPTPHRELFIQPPQQHSLFIQR